MTGGFRRISAQKAHQQLRPTNNYSKSVPIRCHLSVRRGAFPSGLSSLGHSLCPLLQSVLVAPRTELAMAGLSQTSTCQINKLTFWDSKGDSEASCEYKTQVVLLQPKVEKAPLLCVVDIGSCYRPQGGALNSQSSCLSLPRAGMTNHMASTPGHGYLPLELK
jgi:hypothetical protein